MTFRSNNGASKVTVIPFIGTAHLLRPESVVSLSCEEWLRRYQQYPVEKLERIVVIIIIIIIIMTLMKSFPCTEPRCNDEILVITNTIQKLKWIITRNNR